MIVSMLSPIAGAVSETDPYGFTLNPDGASYTLTSVLPTFKFKADIPETYKTYPVTAIGKNAFSECDYVYEIVIPKTVDKIEDGAFFDCSALSEITCRSESFTVDDGVLFTSDKKSIVYAVDRTMTEYSVPNGVQSIYGYAFASLTSLISVNIPEGVVKLGSHCFAYCTSLTDIFLPSSVTEIPDHAFSCCTSLSGFCAEPTVKKVGKGAFNSCISMASVLLPDGAEVGEHAFFSCDDLTVYAKKDSSAYQVAVADGVDTCNVTYTGENRVQGVEISLQATQLKTGDVIDMNVNGIESAQVNDIVVFSSNHKAVSYSNGKLYANGVGTSTVSVVSVDGLFFDSVTITVSDPDSPLASEHPYKNGVDERKTYTVAGSPSKIAVTFSNDTHVEDGEDFIYILDKDDEQYGVYTGYELSGKTVILNGDTVTVRLTSDSKVSSYGYRIVSAASADGVIFPEKIEFVESSVSLDVTNTYQTKLNIIPKEAFCGDIIYYSSNDAVAWVDQDGKIYASGNGEATITAVTEYGEAVAHCKITVKDNAINGIEYEYDSTGAVVRFCKSAEAVISIPETVEGKTVYKIAKGAFAFNTSLKELNIPKTVTKIEKGAFGGNSSFEKVTVSADNTSYMSNDNCILSKNGKNLITVCGAVSLFTVPDTVQTIDQQAFAYMYKLTKITVGSSVSSIIYGAVESCHALNEIAVSGSSTVYSSSNGILYSKNGKKLVLYPSGRTGDFTVPNSVSEIAFGAFHTCASLKKVTIPASVITIAPEAFCGSGTVSAIAVDSENKNFTSYNGALYDKSMSKLLAVPPMTVGEYTVPDGVKTVSRYAFYGCDIGKVNLPVSLETIGLNAFYKNRSLSLVVLPPFVKTIEAEAFAGCDVVSVVGGDTISAIGTAAFGTGAFYCKPDTDTQQTAQNAGIVFKTADYLYDQASGIIAVKAADSYISDVALKTDIRLINKDGKNADEYTLTFTHDGERFIPSSEYHVTVYTKAKTGDEIFVYDEDNECVGYSVSARVSFTSNGGNYTVTPSFASKHTTYIGIRSYPKKTEYYKDEKLNSDGLVLYYLDEYGEVSLITGGFELERIGDGYGAAKVRAKYNTHTVEYDITIVPRPLTGEVMISGDVTPGSVLTAQIKTVTPDDIPYIVTWYVDGTAVKGNNTLKYTVTEADMGKKIKVRITAAEGYAGSFESAEILAAKDAITSDKYTFDKSSGTVGKIPSQTTVSVFLSNIDPAANVKITKNGTELSGDKLIPTGATVSLVYGNKTVVSYGAVVTGDINGDGKISITDFTRLKAFLLGEEEKDALKKKASDINGDGKISITDFTQLKTHLLGGKQIVPK